MFLQLHDELAITTSCHIKRIDYATGKEVSSLGTFAQ